MNKKKLEKRLRNKADRTWKEEVKKVFSGCCAVCHSPELVNCHHIIPRNIKELRHDVKNGICLCPLHHKWGTYSAHKHPLWFFVWLSRNRSEQLDYLAGKIIIPLDPLPL